jgi:hypothetical protein
VSGMQKYPEQAIEWGKKLIEKLGGKISPKNLKKVGATEEFYKLFKIKMTVRKMNAWLSYYKYGKSHRRTGGRKSPERIAMQSNFLVVVVGAAGIGWQGFDTEDEVKQFIIDSGILGNIIVFKRTPIDIKYDIKIG